jgi:transcriptional regulator with XRE-family HTH domain
MRRRIKRPFWYKMLNIFNYLGDKLDLEGIGAHLRRARVARGLTQAQLALAAGVTRTTLNQLENGVIKDLGIRKIEALLHHVGLEMIVADAAPQPKSTDFLRVASTSASVGFRERLTEKELLRALLTGKVPPGRRPHLRKLLEESPRVLMEGLMRQVGRWARPGKIEKNVIKMAAVLGIPESGIEWLILSV